MTAVRRSIVENHSMSRFVSGVNYNSIAIIDCLHENESQTGAHAGDLFLDLTPVARQRLLGTCQSQRPSFGTSLTSWKQNAPDEAAVAHRRPRRQSRPGASSRKQGTLSDDSLDQTRGSLSSAERGEPINLSLSLECSLPRVMASKLPAFDDQNGSAVHVCGWTKSRGRRWQDRGGDQGVFYEQILCSTPDLGIAHSKPCRSSSPTSWLSGFSPRLTCAF